MVLQKILRKFMIRGALYQVKSTCKLYKENVGYDTIGSIEPGSIVMFLQENIGRSKNNRPEIQVLYQDKIGYINSSNLESEVINHAESKETS